MMAVIWFSDDAEPDLIAIEGYSYGSKAGREMAGELGGVLRHMLWHCGFTYIDVPPTTLKQYVTGKGNAQKSMMIKEVYKKWQYEAADDNEADAYSLARLAADYHLGATKIEKMLAKIVVVDGRKGV